MPTAVSPTTVAEDAQYLKELLAWLYNRRGEAYALAANQSADAGEEDAAKRRETQAIEDFGRAVQLNPEHWRAHHNRGVSLALAGDYTAALESFDQAIGLNPGYANTRFNRAELLLEAGQYADAAQEYSHVLELQPNDIDSLIGRGHARFYLAQFDQALADFDAVIQVEPENAVAFADRADLHAYLGHWQDAATDYRRAIRLDRQLGRAYQSAAWLMSTCPEPRLRDPALALRAAQRAIQLDGTDDYRYLDTLAAAQANAENYVEAAQTIQQALQSAPEDVRPELQQRLSLYQAQRPYRDETR